HARREELDVLHVAGELDVGAEAEAQRQEHHHRLDQGRGELGAPELEEDVTVALPDTVGAAAGQGDAQARHLALRAAPPLDRRTLLDRGAHRYSTRIRPVRFRKTSSRLARR